MTRPPRYHRKIAPDPKPNPNPGGNLLGAIFREWGEGGNFSITILFIYSIYLSSLIYSNEIYS